MPDDLVTMTIHHPPPDRIAEAIDWRRDLHRHPELAYQEQRTSDFVAAQLERFGFDVHRGLAGTGVVGTLARGTGKRAIGIRADMDALPIEERGDCQHISVNPGKMHACGHDGHVAMALAAAGLCAAMDDLHGTIHFIFQPAEEGAAGAKRMIEEGLFRLFPCDSVYGLHNWPALPLGSCVALDGPIMAANAAIDIELKGKGCHGAMPHQGTDVMLTACQLVAALQTIVSRNLDPVDAAVVSITQMQAGTAYNVIPERCSLRGSARWLTASAGDLVEERVHEIALALAQAGRCSAEVRFERRYPATINDPAAAALIRSLAGAAGLALPAARPSMASEDFAFMLRAVPGCYFWLGSGRSPEDPGLHSPLFDFNDDLVPIGVSLWVALVRAELASPRAGQDSA